jgi:hypothetical protein
MLHVRVDVPPHIGAIEAMAEGLVRLNEWYMEQGLDNGLELPSLYETNVVYRREPPGQEWWESAQDVLSLTTHKSGDCEDLAAYMAAWYRVMEGEDVRVKVIRTKRKTYHAIIEFADGEEEDPSRILVGLEKGRLHNARAQARSNGR